MRWFGSTTFDKAAEGSPGPAVHHGRRPRIGIALGAGSARGWAHIGTLLELDAAGLRPDIIAGTSIGAVVGGCYAAGKLADLDEFARGLTKRRMFSLMDLTFSGSGLIAGGRLRARLEAALGGTRIEDLPITFAAVATEMGTGHEVWLSSGGVADAVRASYALPGIFEPVQIGGRWMFDGALVNPIPVTVCRALGAEFVIAVNINAETRRQSTMTSEALPDEAIDELKDQAEDAAQIRVPGLLPALRAGGSLLRRQFAASTHTTAPGIATAMVDAFNITQDRIARSRLAGDPPDFAINTRLAKIGFFDFHRAAEMIELGRDAVRKALPELRELVAANGV